MKKTNSVLLSTPYLLWMAAFTLVPLGVVGYYALTDPSTGVFTLGNLKNLGMYLPVLWKSIAYSFVSAMICLLLGYPLAYSIARRTQRVQQTMIMLIMLPMWMNFLLRIYAWMSILENRGFINQFLGLFGLRANLINTDGAVVLGMVYDFLPFMILPIYTTLIKIDRSHIEAAHDLGANGLNTFLRVVLPQSVPGIISGITMVFVPAMSTFAVSTMLGGKKIVLFGQLIEEKFLINKSFGVGSTLSLVLIILVIISMVIMRRADRDEGREGGTLW